MELVHSEKLIVDEHDTSIFYSKQPIYDIVEVRLGQRVLDRPSIDKKRLNFPFLIPDDELDNLYLTYLTDDGRCGQCLTIEDMEKQFYMMLFNVEDEDEIEWYDNSNVRSYIVEALEIIRQEKADYRQCKQYSFQIGKTVKNLCGCETKYQDQDNIPQRGLARTREWVYLPYQSMEDTIIFEKQGNMNTEEVDFWYKVPHVDYITCVTIDWRDVEPIQKDGYFFFPNCQGTVTIEYHPEILIWENCCIAFENKFARLPVLYALYHIMQYRGDDRWQFAEKDYMSLLADYKKYLRRANATDINWKDRITPDRKYYRWRKNRY